MALPMRTTDDHEGLVESSNVVEVVDQLLRAWREPEKVIRHVEQKIQIPGKDIRILTTVHINPQAFGAKDEIIFPLWSPLKGESVDAEISSKSNVTLLTHEESEALASSALAFRVIKLWESYCIGPGNEGREDEVNDHMREMLIKVPEIPYLSEQEAQKIFDEFFDKKSNKVQKLNADFVTSNPASEYNLCLLARRLTRRSLTLVQINLSARPKIEISNFQTWDQQVAKGKERFRRFLSPLSLVSAEPRLEIHLPWAKKSRHYSLRIELPEGYFLLDTVTVDVKKPKGGESFAINSSMTLTGGRRFYADLRNKHRENRKIYLLGQVSKSHDTSSAVALGTSFTIAFLQGFFTLIAMLDPGGAQGQSNVYVTIFVAIAIGVVPLLQNRRGVKIFYSRLISYTFPFVLIGTSVWFISWQLRDSLLSGLEKVFGLKVPHALDVIFDFMGFVPPIISLTLFFVLFYYRATRIREYKKSLNIRYSSNNTVYNSDDNVSYGSH